MTKKQTYEQMILSLQVGVPTAEEEYITDEHLAAYEEFVTKVQEKYNFETREEADNKAQELIKNYQEKERQESIHNADSIVL